MSRRRGRGKRAPGARERSGPETSGAPSASASSEPRFDPEHGEAEASPPRRARLAPLVIIFALQAMLLAIFYGLARLGTPPARLLAFDHVAAAGEEFTVRAVWDQDVPPFLSTLRRGHQIAFRWEEPPAGAEEPLPGGKTDLNGIVEVLIEAPEEPGVRTLLVEARERSAESALSFQTRAEVLVLEEDRPLALVMVPGTLTASESGALDLAPPLPGARETMERLAASNHQIVYLGHLAPRDAAPMRVWLENHRFPRGPLIFPASLEGAGAGRAHGGSLEPVVANLQKLGAEIAFAFALRPEDLRALETSGARVFRIHPEPSLEAGVESVPDWAALAKRLP